MEALSELIQNLQRENLTHISLQCQDTPYPLSPSVEPIIFRIAQEALQNSLKHAKATDIRLILTYGPDRFRLSVHDNGIGFDQSLFGKEKTDGSGFGLLAIADRAQSIGGTLQIETQPGHGTVVTLEYPIILKRSR
ncbi:MAG TPA: ATP-binding protein [Bacillota bacterium]|nr:ATP-binding protein [Bacillota bacterium]